MKTLGTIFTLLTSLILGPVWRGYVFSILWTWFVVATFDARPLSTSQALGLSIVVSFLTHQEIRSPKDERDFHTILLEGFFKTFLGPLLVLGLAAIVRQYLPV